MSSSVWNWLYNGQKQKKKKETLKERLQYFLTLHPLLRWYQSSLTTYHFYPERVHRNERKETDPTTKPTEGGLRLHIHSLGFEALSTRGHLHSPGEKGRRSKWTVEDRKTRGRGGEKKCRTPSTPSFRPYGRNPMLVLWFPEPKRLEKIGRGENTKRSLESVSLLLCSLESISDVILSFKIRRPNQPHNETDEIKRESEQISKN